MILKTQLYADLQLYFVLISGAQFFHGGEIGGQVQIKIAGRYNIHIVVICDTDAGHAHGNGFFDLAYSGGITVAGKFRV